MAFDPADDPFRERSSMPWRARFQILGYRFDFQSNSAQLLGLVSSAYRKLPAHRLSPPAAPFRIRLWLSDEPGSRPRKQPPALRTHSGPEELLCGVMDAGNFALLSPHERTALIVVSRDMLRFPYHLRYELLEFAVFTLASRAQGLVPLHAACIGRSGRGLLLVGDSGAGKSTLALHCLTVGLDFLSEDAVFVRPDQLLATGVSNFLHLRQDSLRFLDDQALASRVRKSPIIQRRSGVRKFEVDMRRLGRRLAPSPLRVEGVVFLSSRSAGSGATAQRLRNRDMIARLTTAQPYPASLPSWKSFRQRLVDVRGFELRRGQHPIEAAVALRLMLS